MTCCPSPCRTWNTCRTICQIATDCKDEPVSSAAIVWLLQRSVQREEKPLVSKGGCSSPTTLRGFGFEGGVSLFGDFFDTTN